MAEETEENIAALETWADQIWIEHGYHPRRGILTLGEITSEEAEKVCRGLAVLHGDLRVEINSPGGTVEDGKAIFGMLRRYEGKKTCMINGQASSMAAVVVQVFCRRLMDRDAHMLLHDGVVSEENHARDFEQTALQSKRDRLWYYAVLAKRCGRTPQYWGKLCTRDTYFSAREALRAGLVDEII